MMTEIEYLAEISEKLDIVGDRLEILIYIGIFAILIHYSEKWLRIAFNSEKDGGKL